MHLPPRSGSNELARVVDLDPLELSTLLASDAASEKIPLSPLPAATIEPPQENPPTQTVAATQTITWRSWAAVNANELTWIALLGGGMLFTALLADH
jgi:hypothetical protein